MDLELAAPAAASGSEASKTEPKPRGGIGKNQHWVDKNHFAIENAKALNGGIIPLTPALYTSDFPNKDIWSPENLPEILFYLQPPLNPMHGVNPEPFTRADGAQLRKFDILPDYISVDVEGWLIHAWRCTDDRIKQQDITDRMCEDPDYFGMPLVKPPHNAMANDCYRGCRKILGSFNDTSKPDEPLRNTVECVEKASFEKIWMNTVLSRSVDYPDRLVRVKFVRKGIDQTGQYMAVPLEVTPENYYDTTYPLDYFCNHKFDPIIKSELEVTLESAMSELWDLQKKADLHGLINWHHLERSCLPAHWFSRTKKGAPKKKTYDGGCEICTWTTGCDLPMPEPQSFNFEYLRRRHTQQETAIDFEKAFRDINDQPATIVAQHGRVLKRASSEGAIAVPKRVKRLERNTNSDMQVLEEDNGVREISVNEALETNTQYKIKYLEEDEEYSGFWETDAEVEIDSDAETVVDLTRTGTPRAIAKLRSPAKSLLNGPVVTSVDLTLPDEDELLASIENPEDYGAVASCNEDGLESRPYMPVDFMEDSFMDPEPMPDYSGQNHALVVGMPLDDPFGADDAFTTFQPQPNYNNFHFFHMDDLTSDRPQINGIQEQSMQALQQYSATLHSVMDLESAGEEIADYPAQVLDDGHHAADVTPPTNVTGANMSKLMLTDEINRFGGLNNYPGGSYPEQSPLGHMGLSYTTTINMHPMSPIRASMEIQGRRVFTLHDDDENIEF